MFDLDNGCSSMVLQGERTSSRALSTASVQANASKLILQTTTQPKLGNPGFSFRMFTSSVLPSFKDPEEEMALEDSPTMVKVDRGENQVSSCRGRRCGFRVLGYVTGDMKEFASWLKGIYTFIHSVRDERSSFEETLCLCFCPCLSSALKPSLQTVSCFASSNLLTFSHLCVCVCV